MATREELLAEAKRQQLLVQARQLQQQMAASPTPEPTPTPTPMASRPSEPVPQETEGFDWPQLGRRAMAPFRGAADTILKFPSEMASLRNAAIEAIPAPSGQMLPLWAALQMGKVTNDPIAEGLRSLAPGQASPVGEDPVEDFGQRVGEWGTPLWPSKLTKLDAAMGIGAGLGGAVGGETGEMVGGLSPLAANLTGLSKVPGRVADAGKDFWQKLWGEGASEADQQKLAEWVYSHAHDPEQALKNINDAIARGEVGDIGDLSRDQGLANLIRGTQKGSPVRGRLIQKAEDRDAQIAQMMRGAFPDLDPAMAEQAAGRAAGRRAEALRTQRAQPAEVPQSVVDLQAQEMKQIGSDLRAAQTATDPALGAVRTTQTQAQASKGLAEVFETTDEVVKKAISDPAWEKIDNAPPIQIDEFNTAFDDAMRAKKLTRSQRKRMAARAAQALEDYRTPDGAYAVNDLADLASDLKADARATDSAKDARMMNITAQLIDRVIESSPTGPAYKAAKEATKKYKRLIGGKKIDKQRSREAGEELGRFILGSQEKGATRARELLRAASDDDFQNPDMLKAMEDYILARARSTGGVDQNFLNQNSEFLEVWAEKRPEFKAKLDRAVTAGEQLAGAQKTAEKRIAKSQGAMEEAIRASEKTKKANIKRVASKLADDKLIRLGRGDNPEKVIEQALNLGEVGRKQTQDFRRFVNAFKSPEDKAALASLVGDVVSRRMGNMGWISKNPEKFQRMQEQVKYLIGDDNMQAFADAKLMADVQRFRDEAAPVRFKDMPHEQAEELAATVGAYLFLSASDPKHALLMGGAVRRHLRRIFKKKAQVREDELKQMVDEFFVNPETWAAQMKNTTVQTAAEADTFLQRLMREPAAVGRALTVGGDDDA